MVNTEICEGCVTKPCVIVCPVQCYQKEKNKLIFSWENCVECGSCRIVCSEGAITWNFPRGGYGVCFRFG